jgi:hypothetical protein
LCTWRWYLSCYLLDTKSILMTLSTNVKSVIKNIKASSESRLTMASLNENNIQPGASRWIALRVSALSHSKCDFRRQTL